MLTGFMAAMQPAAELTPSSSLANRRTSVELLTATSRLLLATSTPTLTSSPDIGLFSFPARPCMIRVVLTLTTVRALGDMQVWRPCCPTVSKDLRSIGLPHLSSDWHSNTLSEIQGQR